MQDLLVRTSLQVITRHNDVIGIDCFTDYYPEEQKLANLSRALNQERFTLIRRDISEMNRFPRVDHVFHVAAQPGVRARHVTKLEPSGRS